MPNGLKQLAENLLELKEAFSEEELLAGSLHPRAEHVILLLRNLAVGAVSGVAVPSPLPVSAQGHRLFLRRGGVFLRNPAADRLLHAEGAAPGDVHGILLRADVHPPRDQLSVPLRAGSDRPVDLLLIMGAQEGVQL